VGHPLSPDGRKVFTANGLSNDVTVIDTNTNQVINTIKAGDGPWGIALSPQKSTKDGRKSFLRFLWLLVFMV
jgi:YVTN family beta-propeller protein